MDMEHKLGKMVAVIKVNIIMVLYKVKEYIIGPTARNTLEAGQTVNKMVRELLRRQKEKVEEENGQVGLEKDGLERLKENEISIQ